jgi:anthranilate synthase/aminodeoxychorismate synthase-like glutamine amidotransferase
MILCIDNYDSFTYNLVDYLGQLTTDLVVYRNDKVELEKIKELSPSGIVISPGPGTPSDAGISCSVIKEFCGDIPILGVCLGHQCIGEVFGAKIVRAPEPVHGKISQIYHNQRGILRDLPVPFPATRYHSLIIEKQTTPACLEITATDAGGLIMAVQHIKHKTYGVQFHPESILTKVGLKIIKNWLQSISS